VLARGVPLCVPLLFLAVYLWDGIRRAGGYVKQTAFTCMSRLTGMRTQGTATTEGCSSPGAPLSASEGQRALIWLVQGSNSSEPFWYGSETVDRGVNGPQRLRSVD
jgi:hypothetical protein